LEISHRSVSELGHHVVGRLYGSIIILNWLHTLHIALVNSLMFSQLFWIVLEIEHWSVIRSYLHCVWWHRHFSVLSVKFHLYEIGVEPNMILILNFLLLFYAHHIAGIGDVIIIVSLNSLDLTLLFSLLSTFRIYVLDVQFVLHTTFIILEAHLIFNYNRFLKIWIVVLHAWFGLVDYLFYEFAHTLPVLHI